MSPINFTRSITLQSADEIAQKNRHRIEIVWHTNTHYFHRYYRHVIIYRIENVSIHIEMSNKQMIMTFQYISSSLTSCGWEYFHTNYCGRDIQQLFWCFFFHICLLPLLITYFFRDIFLALMFVNQSLVNFRDFNSESTDKTIFLLAL